MAVLARLTTREAPQVLVAASGNAGAATAGDRWLVVLVTALLVMLTSMPTEVVVVVMMLIVLPSMVVVVVAVVELVTALVLSTRSRSGSIASAFYSNRHPCRTIYPIHHFF